MMKQTKMVGVSIVEVMFAITVLLFASYAALVLLGTSSSKGVLMSKKIDLVNSLDDKVSEYIISKSFDDSGSGGRTYTKTDITNEGNNGNGNGNSSTEGNQSGGETGNATGVEYSLYKFTATDSNYDIAVDKKVFEREQ
jgi:type II secretory pathway pseudopilin PulG